MGKAMLTTMAAFAQLERDTMIERTRAGLVVAAANGRKGGRPHKIDDADATKARQLREKGIAATTFRWCAALCVTLLVPRIGDRPVLWDMAPRWGRANRCH
jgi:DNA invertase Pin-like site-specific DNA recombinase